jgi:hypothetical protein
LFSIIDTRKIRAFRMLMPRHSSILLTGILIGLFSLGALVVPVARPGLAEHAASVEAHPVSAAPSALPAAADESASSMASMPERPAPGPTARAVMRIPLLTGVAGALLAGALFGLAVLLHRAGVRRRMALTGQSAEMFMLAADAETRAANARVIATLANQGTPPSGFVASAPGDRAEAVLRFLIAQDDSGATPAQIAASVGGTRRTRSRALRTLLRRGVISRDGQRYVVLPAGPMPTATPDKPAARRP